MAWDVSADPLKAAEAIAWFRARVPLTPEAWEALTERSRRKAFKVAGALRLSMCAEVLRSLNQATARGVPFKEWQKQIGPKLRKDWGGTVKNPSWRLETIFRTNVQSAYAAGRWRQLREPAIVKTRPYWLFDSVMDGRTTPVCRISKGTCLPNNHAWWATHTPPLHFNCRSGIRALRADAAKARGLTRYPTGLPAQKTFGLSPDKFEWEPDPKKYPPELRAAVEKVRAQARRLPKRVKPPAPVAPVAPVVAPAPVATLPASGGFVSGRHVGRVVLEQGITAAEAQAILREAGQAVDPVMLAFVERHPVRTVTFKPLGAKHNGTAIQQYGSVAGGVGRDLHTVLEFTTARTPGTYGLEWVPGATQSVSTAGDAVHSAMVRTAVHEFAHHCHYEAMVSVDRMISDAARRAGPLITLYAGETRFEYFAESLAAYTFHKADLWTHDPVGYAMVADVLRLLEHLP